MSTHGPVEHKPEQQHKYVRGTDELRVLVPCIFPVNLGDALLLESLRDAADDSDLKAFFSYTSLLPVKARGFEAVGQPMALAVRLSSRLGPGRTAWACIVAARTLLRWVDISAKLPPRLLRLIEPTTFTTLRDLSRSSDIVVTAPGGYLIAEHKSEWMWLSHLVAIRLLRSTGATVIGSPCSIGPFHPRYASLAKRLRESYDSLYLRDDTSVQICRSLGFGDDQIRRTSDLAFAHHLPDGITERTNTVGVAVRYYHFADSPDPLAARKRFEKSLLDSLRSLRRDHNVEIVFVPHDNTGTVGDLDYARTLSSQLDFPTGVIDSDLSVESLLSLYASFRLLIGVRMHACIGALISGTPIIPIAYEPKTYGTMADFGIEDQVLDIREVSTRQICTSADRLLVDDIQKSEIQRTVRMVAAESRSFWEKVKTVTSRS